MRINVFSNTHRLCAHQTQKGSGLSGRIDRVGDFKGTVCLGDDGDIRYNHECFARGERKAKILKQLHDTVIAKATQKGSGLGGLGDVRGTICPRNHSPVTYGGVTYNNECLARAARERKANVK